jgi:hypothetical protein
LGNAFGNAFGSTEAFAGSMTPLPAPIGHLQPRAQPFSPRAPAEQAEQQQQTQFDAEQKILDEQLDKRLNICRC